MNDTGVLNARKVASGKAFIVNEEEIKLPGGQRVQRTVVRHTGSVVVVPILRPGHVLVIRQYRHSLGDYILEFPAGTIDSGEDPLDCAKRELVEEVFHRASEWIDIGMQYPAPGFCDEKQFCYVARNLVPESGQRDEDEIIDIQPMSVADLEKSISSFLMPDAKSLACFLKARLLGLL